MASPVTLGARYEQTFAGFGPASLLQYGTFTPAGTVPTSAGTVAIPCNVKILAAALASSTNAGLTTVLVNFCSGPMPAAPIGAGAIVFTLSGTITAAGTITLTVTGPTPDTSFSVSFQYTNTASIANIVSGINGAYQAALNAGTQPPVAVSTDGASTVTVFGIVANNLLPLMGGPMTVALTAAPAGTGLVISPSTPQTLQPSSFQVAPSDNFTTTTPTSAFASNGQFLFGRYRSLRIGPIGTQAITYPSLRVGQPAGSPQGAQFSLSEYDIVFPCTRPITLCYMLPGTGPNQTNASLLVRPVILDPNQPYPAGLSWTPRQQTIGAPSTA